MRSSSASRSLTCASSEACLSAAPLSSRQASTSISTTPSSGSSSALRAASSRPSVVWASLTSPRVSGERPSRASKVSGGICSWTAVRNAPQAAASCEILRAMPRSSGAPPPDLRVRASACIPLGRRTSSRPGTFLQSSARARLVSSLPRRRSSNSSGRSSGGSLLSRGSSARPSEGPASVPPSLGMGSDIMTPSTNMNVKWCLHAVAILSRPPPIPAGFSGRSALSFQPGQQAESWLAATRDSCLARLDLGICAVTRVV